MRGGDEERDEQDGGERQAEAGHRAILFATGAAVRLGCRPCPRPLPGRAARARGRPSRHRLRQGLLQRRRLRRGLDHLGAAVDPRRQAGQGHADRRPRRPPAPRRQDVPPARRARARTTRRSGRSRRLKPGTKYYFRFSRKGARSDRGTFRPRRSRAPPSRCASRGPATRTPSWTPARRSCTSGPSASSTGWRARRTPSTSTSATRSTPTRTRSSPDVDPLALTVAQKRAKYRTMLDRRLRCAGCARRARCTTTGTTTSSSTTSRSTRRATRPRRGRRRARTPRIVTVDGRKLYPDGVKAFREYMPVTYSKSRGIYRSFRWGKNLEVFFLDERSFRDAGADDNGTCDNPPGSGNRDLAPTAPQRIRTRVRRRRPAARQPAAARLPGADQRPEPRLPRRRAVRPLHAGGQALQGDVQGRDERAADPAVLRRPVRPLGGLRRRAAAG